jgi:uncharacterized protein (TIGR02466 family)
MNYEANIIFATPLLYAHLDRDVTKSEIEAIKNLEYTQIASNSVSKNKYILEMSEFKELKTFFQGALNFYVKEIIKGAEPEIYITQSWATKTIKNESHHKHSHPNSFLSGAFYVEIETEDNITFYRRDRAFPLSIDPIEFNVFNSDSWKSNIKKGQLIIFPSNLEHATPFKKENNSRISISFNTFIKGAIGTEDNVTKLYL